ncbi:MAG: KEOPS complex subunit Cgi121 [Methanomassiliicoccales archaeon]
MSVATAMIHILGARGDVGDPEEVLDILRSLGQGVPIDPDMVVGRDHLESAAEHALRAFERGTNTASSLGMETLMYASGERQISRATEKMGVKGHSQGMALVLFDLDPEKALEALGMERDYSLLEGDLEKLRRHGIGEEEILAAGDLALDLVLERVAFVEMTKR